MPDKQGFFFYKVQAHPTSDASMGTTAAPAIHAEAMASTSSGPCMARQKHAEVYSFLKGKSC